MLRMKKCSKQHVTNRSISSTLFSFLLSQNVTGPSQLSTFLFVSLGHTSFNSTCLAIPTRTLHHLKLLKHLHPKGKVVRRKVTMQNLSFHFLHSSWFYHLCMCTHTHFSGVSGLWLAVGTHMALKIVLVKKMQFYDKLFGHC